MFIFNFNNLNKIRAFHSTPIAVEQNDTVESFKFGEGGGRELWDFFGLLVGM